LQTGVLGTGINRRSQPQLFNAVHSLKVRMLNNIIQKIVRDIDKSENRVVDDFTLIGFLHFILILQTFPGIRTLRMLFYFKSYHEIIS